MSTQSAYRGKGAQFRLPPELKTWLQGRAVDNHRSLNGEVIQRLEESRRQELARQQAAAA